MQQINIWVLKIRALTLGQRPDELHSAYVQCLQYIFIHPSSVIFVNTYATLRIGMMFNNTPLIMQLLSISNIVSSLTYYSFLNPVLVLTFSQFPE